MFKSKAAILVGAMAISGVASADLNKGLVAYWSFDDCTATDTSGKGHSGTIEGAPQCVDGIQEKAFYFNGNSDLIRIGNPFPTTLPNTAPLTVSAWIKTATTKDAGGIITQHSACVNNDDHFHLTLYGPAFLYLQGDVFNSDRVAVNRNTVANDKWHHITMKYDGLKTYLYVDGVQKNVLSTVPKSDFNPSLDIVIGGFHAADSCDVNHNFEGIIDEARIYSRALAASEIQALYYQGNPPIIKGTAPWVTSHMVTCQNTTQNTIVEIPKTKASAWDCEKAGLPVKSGDKIKVTIEGTKY